MIRTTRIALAAAFLLAACASTPAYTPAAAPGGVGYSETRIESNRYFVTYRAGGAADAALLQDYALLRAAELALQNGRDWFWVDRRALDEAPRADTRPTLGVGVGAGSYGRRSGVNLGIGVNFPIGSATAARAHAATVEIRFGEGVKPDDSNAYDAHAIAANIRARLARPR